MVWTTQGDCQNLGRISSRWGRRFENNWALVPSPLPDPEAKHPQRHRGQSWMHARKTLFRRDAGLTPTSVLPPSPSRVTGPLK